MYLTLLAFVAVVSFVGGAMVQKKQEIF